MKIWLPGEPPTATAQQHKVTVRGGYPCFYDPANVKEAKRDITLALAPHAPEEPLKAPIKLTVRWYFKAGKKNKDGEWKITKPDTDNMLKALKDIMSDLGFWEDDSRVVSETTEKKWSSDPGTYIEVETIPLIDKEEVMDTERIIENGYGKLAEKLPDWNAGILKGFKLAIEKLGGGLLEDLPIDPIGGERETEFAEFVIERAKDWLDTAHDEYLIAFVDDNHYSIDEEGNIVDDGEEEECTQLMN